MMFSLDGISGLVCLAISVWLWVLTYYLPPAAIVTIGPAFYPRIVLALLGLLSAILIVMDFRAMRALHVAGGPVPAATAVAKFVTCWSVVPSRPPRPPAPRRTTGWC